jgi:iron complex outermembrane receptor protein
MNHFLSLLGALLLPALLHAQVRLTGTVLGGDAEPLEGVTVAAGEDHRFGTWTDREGRFALSGLRAGPVRLRLSSIGHEPIDTLLQLTDAGLDLRLRLRPTAVLMREAEVSALRAGERSPFAQGTVTREEIARMNTGVDLPILLDLQPSVVTTTDAGTGIGYTGLRIRGSDATRINVTLNGVPINDPESQAVFWVNMPDLASGLEDIEVQRGAGSSTNGPGAFGASINMRSARIPAKAFGEVSAFAGSYNTQRYNVRFGTGLLSDADRPGLGSFSLDGRLSTITSDGYIDRATADLKSYQFQAGWLGRTRSLRFFTMSGHEVTYQAWEGVLREVLDTNRTYNPYTYDNQVDDYRQTHYQLLFDQQLGSSGLLNVTLFRVLGAGFFEQYREGDDLERYGIGPIAIGDTVLTNGDVIRRRWLDNTLDGVNVSLEQRFGEHRLVLGGSYSRYVGDHFGEVIWAQWAGESPIRQRYYDNTGTKTDANAFAKFSYAVNDRVDLYGDAQVRSVSHEFLGFNNALENVTQEASWTFFNPKAGVQWKVHEGGRLYGSVAMANREPNRSDLIESSPQSRPRPERMVDYELGYERRTGRSAIGVNLYYMDYTDQLVLTGELNDVGYALRTNVPESFRAGVELTGAVQFARRFTWRPNATFSQNRITDFTEFVDDWDNGGQQQFALGGTEIAFSPSVIAGSELICRFWESAERGHGDVALVTKYVGRQYLDNTANADRMLDPYLVNDVRLNLGLKGTGGLRAVDINITVRNVFSELYESNGWVYSFFADGRRQDLVGLFPQAPLNVLAGVVLRF